MPQDYLSNKESMSIECDVVVLLQLKVRIPLAKTHPLQAQLATMCFLSYRVAYTVAITHLQTEIWIARAFPGVEGSDTKGGRGSRVVGISERGLALSRVRAQYH
ncbi:hypothetical protein TNCV_954841 [Trichonephila clavipes]|nr:hypothetical protein TNCV_954841 [Trichonephila clavipes]